MPTLTITPKATPYAHRLCGYQGLCSRLHGHNARVEIVVESDSLNDQGFVADFYEVAAMADRVLSRFNHALLLEFSDPLCPVLKSAGEHFVALKSPPTAEHLARLVLDGMVRELAAAANGVRVVRVSWEEEPGFVAGVTP